MFPVMVGNILQPLHYFGRVDFNRQLSSAIEASRRQIDGPDDRAGVIGKQHFAVQFQVLQLMHLDSHIVHDAQAANTLRQFLFLQFVRRTRHHMHFHAALLSADQPLDDHGILIAFVLDEQAYAWLRR